MLTPEQWFAIMLNFYGLRSEDNASIITSAASYAMNCDQTLTLRSPPPLPANWLSLLRRTITHMQSFGNYEDRYLMIVSKSNGNAWEYEGCFPKCSSRSTTVIASTSLNDSVENLIRWVLANIPKE